MTSNPIAVGATYWHCLKISQHTGSWKFQVKKIVKALHLSSADRSLLLGSALLLMVIRMGLWLLPFRMLLGLLSRTTGSNGNEADQSSIARAAWSVRVMSRYVPAASCLTQALAMVVL